MMKKSKLLQNRKFPLVKKALVKRFGKAKTEDIIVSAAHHYEECETLCQRATKGEWEHLGTILLTTAMYLALKEYDSEIAYTTTYAIMMELCGSGGAALGAVMKIPGMKSVFMWGLPKLAIRMFGPACGFQYENFAANQQVLQMDMTDCPYCRYAQRLGCPELMPVFCDSDVAAYGSMPGIRFERTQTLGTGGCKCDFKFIRE